MPSFYCLAMSQHTVTVWWKKSQGADFLKRKYSREHIWTFDGGAVVPASSSPHIVPLPFSNPANVDPEEAFVASVSSCHLLWFLWFAGEARFDVESYCDAAVGRMTKNDEGELWISEIILRPDIVYAGAKPSAAEERDLHHSSHAKCFIANSIRTNVRVEQVGSV